MIKQFILLIFCCLSTVCVASDGGDRNSVGVLHELTTAIESLGSYEATFSVVVNGEHGGYSGCYGVDSRSERYVLWLPGILIFGDSEVRYTVDSLQREVVVEPISDMAPMVISNPARAFTMLDRSFTAQMKYSGAEYYTLKLTPKVRDRILDSSELQISRKDHLPIEVLYRSEGDEIVIHIDDIRSVEQILIPDSYPDNYEVIDFR